MTISPNYALSGHECVCARGSFLPLNLTSLSGPYPLRELRMNFKFIQPWDKLRTVYGTNLVCKNTNELPKY